MKKNITQYVLEKLENNYDHEWKRLPSKPSDNDSHSFLIAIDSSKNLLTSNLELSNAIIIGTYKTSHKCVEMLQNQNMQISYLATKDKDKVGCYTKLRSAVRKIIMDFYEDSQQTIRS